VSLIRFIVSIPFTVTPVDVPSSMAVGFCDDQASFNRMLGRESGAWGFHSDDGKIFDNLGTGRGYHIPYGRKNVTIGCGVNFDKNTAFYTRDGVLIGMNQAEQTTSEIIN